MSNAKHTAGCWKFLKNGMLVTADETQIIGTFHADRTNNDDNRALIAAAPELLVALEKALTLIKGSGADEQSLTENFGGQYAKKVLAARAAIGKAKGE